LINNGNSCENEPILVDIMKRIALLFIFTFLLSSCEKDADTSGDDLY